MPNSMEVRIESMICLWDDKIPTMFLEFVNLLTLATSEEQLRASVKDFAEKHELDRFFLYGFGRNCGFSIAAKGTRAVSAMNFTCSMKLPLPTNSPASVKMSPPLPKPKSYQSCFVTFALTSMPCIFGRHRWAFARPVNRASDAIIIKRYFFIVSAPEVR